MCVPQKPKAPPPPPPPPSPAAPAPLMTMAPAEGSSRKDATTLQANRGRSSLRIDRTISDTGSTGSGLNIRV